MAHYFHIVIAEKTISDLMKAGELKNIKKVSRFISKILDNYYYEIEKLHFTGHNQGKKYEFVDIDLELTRNELWIPLPEELYQRLIKIHADLNFYSIAQIIRAVIHEYLKLIDLGCSHNEILTILKKNRINWEKDKEKLSIRPNSFSQLRKSSSLVSNKHQQYVAIYSPGAVLRSIFTY